MALLGIPVNTGTGPKIVVDTVGTDNYQVVKIMQAADGATASLMSTFAVSGTLTANPITVTTGTVNVVNTVAISGTATVIPSGTQSVSVVNAHVVTATISNVVAISGTASVSAITTGTISVVNILSASGVTIASIATGTVTALAAGTQTIAGTVSATLLATTANIGAFVGTAHASQWNAYAVNTTSGASVIVKTSGAHTLYITDMVLSVDVPSRVDIFSATTTKLSLYLATKGGFSVGLTTPLVLNSNQSLTFQPSASGSAMLFALGYTVT